MTVKQQNTKYVISDFIASAVAYVLFYAVRQKYFDLHPISEVWHLQISKSFYLGITLIPVVWILIFYISGYYRNTYRKSIINELSQTLISIVIGSVFFFFTVLLDDIIKSSSIYYISFLTFIGLEFICVYIPRSIITHGLKQKIRKGKFGFRTIFVGDYESLKGSIYELPKDLGNIVLGFFCNDVESKKVTINGVKYLGNEDDLEQFINNEQVEEVILAYPKNSESRIKSMLEVLYRNNVFIRATQVTADQLIGQVKLFPSYGTSFVEVLRDLMPPYEENLKRMMDICVSLFFMVILSPVLLIVLFRIRLDSKGPIFFTQERIGKNKKPFKMYKFRSMVQNAEAGVPQLTQGDDDPRITRFGKFMRKYRIDELPQFWNVLKGDMSLVGPRPERSFFIDQIVEKDRNYLFLLKVRPGITSLGMVKFGYANTIDKMVERLKYDMIYIKNMSILFDVKVIIYTFRTVLTGKGM